MVFSNEENQFVDKTGKTETFKEVCELAAEIHAFMKDQKKKEEEELEKLEDVTPDADMNDTPQSGSGESVDEDGEEAEGEGNSHPLFDDGDKTESGSSISVDNLQGGDEYEKEIDEALTDKNLSKNLESLIDNSMGRETTYLSVPSVKTDTVVVSPQDVWDYFDRKTAELEAEEHHFYNYQAIQYSYDEYDSFKQSAKKEVNYLVKEFECRKSATAYARATTSRTGILDTTKLHTYKYNEDLFKKISVTSFDCI